MYFKITLKEKSFFFCYDDEYCSLKGEDDYYRKDIKTELFHQILDEMVTFRSF